MNNIIMETAQFSKGFIKAIRGELSLKCVWGYNRLALLMDPEEAFCLGYT